MTIYKTGNMWSRFGKVDLFCITTNGTFTKNGDLVMGAGIAKEAKEKFPNMAKWAGSRLKLYHEQEPYLLPMFEIPHDPLIQLMGLFQVKHHYSEIASIQLIKRSTVQLFRYIVDYPKMTICLNFPGIGLGRLVREDVLPIIELLPNNVEVWEYEAKRV